MSTSYNTRNIPTTSYTDRPWISFIMTEALDFLMTEDDNYLITDESVFNEYWERTIITTSYNVRTQI
jgi:hypothetical protein